MKQKNKAMSISIQSFWGRIVIGILWIGVGIVEMLDGLVVNIVQAVLLVGAVIILVAVTRADREKGDEMSDYNCTKAKAKTSDLMHFVFCGAAIVSALVFGLLKNADISWTRVIPSLFFILIGIQNLIMGVVFCRLEAE